MNQLGLFESTGTDLSGLMERWLDALAAKDALPVRDREGRIEAFLEAGKREMEIIDFLEGRKPAVIRHRGEYYVLATAMLLKATLIDTEEQ